jgi:hypothetical protein
MRNTFLRRLPIVIFANDLKLQIHKANQQFKKGEIVIGLENRPKDHLTPLQSFFQALWRL